MYGVDTTVLEMQIEDGFKDQDEATCSCTEQYSPEYLQRCCQQLMDKVTAYWVELERERLQNKKAYVRDGRTYTKHTNILYKYCTGSHLYRKNCKGCPIFYSHSQRISQGNSLQKRYHINTAISLGLLLLPNILYSQFFCGE